MARNGDHWSCRSTVSDRVSGRRGLCGRAGGIVDLPRRTTLYQLERRTAERAAAIQERFDYLVFQMPSSGERSVTPSLEDISALAGSDISITKRATEEHLLDWYPVDPEQQGAVTIAICQRANASYSDRLLRLVSHLWVGAMILWVVILALLSMANQLSLETALLGVALATASFSGCL
jgi:hypothetical protein